MLDIPLFITIVFIGCTLFSVLMLLYAFSKVSKKSLIVSGTIIFGLLIVQAVLAVSGFYLDFSLNPPRFPLAVIGSFIAIAVAFLKGKKTIAKMSLRLITIIQVVRIPVELVLLWLYQEGKIPEIMTFEGRNFDILVGLTAPFMLWYAFKNNVVKKKLLIAWNLVSLALLISIVVHAILSIPSPFQQFGLNQPNIAIFYFPFVWLPAIVVPIALFCHFISLKQLIYSNAKND